MTTTEPTTRPVQLGDFFEESWGYDQTNIDYYQVVRISSTGKTIWLRHVQSSCVRESIGADYVAPIPDAFSGPEDADFRSGGIFKRKLSTGYQGTPWINMTSYSGAGLWDCTPHYETAVGWGH